MALSAFFVGPLSRLTMFNVFCGAAAKSLDLMLFLSFESESSLVDSLFILCFSLEGTRMALVFDVIKASEAALSLSFLKEDVVDDG